MSTRKIFVRASFAATHLIVVFQISFIRYFLYVHAYVQQQQQLAR